jgi:hypothetical protein
MIKFEFLGPHSKIESDVFTQTLDLEGNTMDLVTVPILLSLPHSQLVIEGVDDLQDRIKAAVEEMVEKLNESSNLTRYVRKEP